MTLNEAGTKVSFDGLASLTNHTGTDYKNAQIALVAGDLNNPGVRHATALQEDFATLSRAPQAKSIQQESIGDFHLFNLPHKVDLLNGQVKQVSFLTAKNVPISRSYDYEFLVYPTLERNQHRVKPNLTLKFMNDQASNLGLPLPAGKIRTFSPDSKGQLQFMGGSNINHTGKGDEVEVRQGKAFDISIHRKQTHFSTVFNGFKVGQELRLTNSRSTPANLVMTANFPLVWEMESSNLKFEKVLGGSAQWKISVPANGEQVLRFQVKMEKR